MQADKFTRRYRFADWLNPEVPVAAAGVYALTQDDVLSDFEKV